MRNGLKAAASWTDKKDQKESSSISRDTEQKTSEDEKSKLEENKVVVSYSIVSGEELV